MSKRVLIPLDVTDRAERALDAVNLLCERGDEIILFSVGEPETSPQKGSRPGRSVTAGITGASGGGVADVARPDVPLYAETKDQAIQKKVAELKDYLESRATRLRDSGYLVTTVAVVSDSPAHAIAEQAKATKPTFIAMVRTTHRSLSDRVFGTVAQQVIRSEVAPVMILPAQ